MLFGERDGKNGIWRERGRESDLWREIEMKNSKTIERERGSYQGIGIQ